MNLIVIIKGTQLKMIFIGEKMEKVNNRRVMIKIIPNLITILRIILTIAIIWICRDGALKSLGVLILSITVIIFMTDILDGKLARKLHSETKAGEIMDVLADMGYIFSMSVLMGRSNIIPTYFLILVCSEFIVFVITSRYIRNESRYLIFDAAGRILAVLYYVTPIFMYICFLKYTTLHIFLYKYGFVSLVLFTLVVVIYRISLCGVNVKLLIRE